MEEIRQGDVVIFPEKDTEIIGVVTEVKKYEYVSCIDNTGKVYPNVYVGYIRKTGRMLPIGELLEQIQ